MTDSSFLKYYEENYIEKPIYSTQLATGKKQTISFCPTYITICDDSNRNKDQNVKIPCLAHELHLTSEYIEETKIELQLPKRKFSLACKEAKVPFLENPTRNFVVTFIKHDKFRYEVLSYE